MSRTNERRVEVFGADEQSEVPVETMRYVRLARLVLEEERITGDVELSVIFVDEPTISDLHERFMGEKGPTDVLSFPLDDDLVLSGRQPDQGGRGPGSPSELGEPPSLLGDVVVCPSVAKSQAEARGVSPESELELLVVHGVLHLLNYDHAEEADEAVMKKREQELLELFAEDDEQ